MMGKLDSRTAFVTGASKGIGAAIAKALAQEGATVIVSYATSKSGADKVVADIAATGGNVMAIQGDFSKPDDIARVYAEIARTHEHLDILVNNAGVYTFGPIEEVTTEEFHREFNLNVLGLLLSTKAAVPLFGPRGGSIINIGSEVGKMAPPHGSVYSATKGALDAITTSLSKEPVFARNAVFYSRLRLLAALNGSSVPGCRGCGAGDRFLFCGRHGAAGQGGTSASCPAWAPRRGSCAAQICRH